MVINPGELNKQIRIKAKNKPVLDKDGFMKGNGEIIVRNCWARVSNVSGSEIASGRTNYTSSRKLFVVRWTPVKIKEGMYILYDGKMYDIKNVSSFHDNKEYIEIVAELNAKEGV